MSLFGPIMAPVMRELALAKPGRNEARWRVVAFASSVASARWEDATAAVDAACPLGEEVLFDTLDGMAAVAGDAILALLRVGPPPFITVARPC